MPTKLDVKTIANLKPDALKPRYIADTLVTGLALRIAPATTGGTKSWSLRYRVGRRMRRYTMSKVVTLADARAMAKELLVQVSKGIDPADVKQERREAETVGEFALIYVAQHARLKKKSWQADETRLTRDVLPHWKHRLMKDITRRDVRELLTGIVERGAPIAANRTRALLHKCFNVALKLDVVETNPVSGTDRPAEEHQRDRVLTHDEVRRFWAACDALPLEMGAAFKLRLITAQRGGEVFSLRWQDVDLDTGWWTIPASRSKNGLAHRVPLPSVALDVLKAIRAKADAHLKAQKRPTPSIFVLAGARGKRQQAEAAATFGIADFHGHDLRRTAASLMSGSGVPRLVISKILNHAEQGVTAVYDRHSYDLEKRATLDAWARTLAGIIEKKGGANVVAFARS
jgi:integrase